MIGLWVPRGIDQRGNMAAALRLIPNEILTIEQLGLPTIVIALTTLVLPPSGQRVSDPVT